jgi:hypothetical protein
VPPATTPEARTAFAEAVAAALPDTWRVVPIPDHPDTIRFEADSLMNTRTTWRYRVPVRLVKRDPQPGALLLLWTAERGGGTYGNERIVNPEDIVVVGVVADGDTPEVLGKAIEYANQPRHLDALWTYVDRRHDLERTIDKRRHESKWHEGYGFTPERVAQHLAATFLPKYFKELPRLRRQDEQETKADAKQKRERAQREAYEAANKRNIAANTAKLRALGYESYDSDPDTFHPPTPETLAGWRRYNKATHVYLNGHHFKNHVWARVIVRVSQLPKLLKFFGHKPPRKRRQPKAKPQENT